jgi:hypothetical protein
MQMELAEQEVLRPQHLATYAPKYASLLQKCRLNQNFVVSNNFQLGNISYLSISIDTCFRRSGRTSSPDEFPLLKYIQHRNASRQLKANNLKKEVPCQQFHHNNINC